jgi:uncharacterized membrane protein
MTKFARPLIVALAILALGASLAALYVHYRIIKDPTYTSFCDINETVSCEAVLESAYATVRGIPVAAGGVIWSTLVLLIAARGMRQDKPDDYAAAAATSSCSQRSVCPPCCTSGTPRSSSLARPVRCA